jgi:hypothetical protein
VRPDHFLLQDLALNELARKEFKARYSTTAGVKGASLKR